MAREGRCPSGRGGPARAVRRGAAGSSRSRRRRSARPPGSARPGCTRRLCRVVARTGSTGASPAMDDSRRTAAALGAAPGGQCGRGGRVRPAMRNPPGPIRELRARSASGLIQGAEHAADDRLGRPVWHAFCHACRFGLVRQRRVAWRRRPRSPTRCGPNIHSRATARSVDIGIKTSPCGRRRPSSFSSFCRRLRYGRPRRPLRRVPADRRPTNAAGSCHRQPPGPGGGGVQALLQRGEIQAPLPAPRRAPRRAPPRGPARLPRRRSPGGTG